MWWQNQCHWVQPLRDPWQAMAVIVASSNRTPAEEPRSAALSGLAPPPPWLSSPQLSVLGPPAQPSLWQRWHASTQAHPWLSTACEVPPHCRPVESFAAGPPMQPQCLRALPSPASAHRAYGPAAKPSPLPAAALQLASSVSFASQHSLAAPSLAQSPHQLAAVEQPVYPVLQCDCWLQLLLELLPPALFRACGCHPQAAAQPPLQSQALPRSVVSSLHIAALPSRASQQYQPPHAVALVQTLAMLTEVARHPAQLCRHGQLQRRPGPQVLRCRLDKLHSPPLPRGANLLG
mmetsp:Transcript_71731/g.171392  ORF Transcript_71731/g.171392 Transcript_71731/m.171392 type:complete len:291 (+) Transcript_71731:3692-4564(+)